MALNIDVKSYYSFENSLVDATGRGNDLTGRNSPTYTTGIQGNALALDGLNQDAARADTADLSIGARDFEFGIWIFPTSVSGTQFIICKDNGGAAREYVIRRNGTKVESYAWSGGVLSSVIQNTTTLSINTWYWLNWYFTSATKKMALRVNDANEISTTLNTTAIDDAGAPFCIGSFNQSGNQWAGRFDELYVRGGSNLITGERTDMYNGGAGRDYAYILASGGAFLQHPGMVGGMKQLNGGMRG